MVEGTGRNTKSLLEYARNTVDEKFPQAEEVWLMYDKDDFLWIILTIRNTALKEGEI